MDTFEKMRHPEQSEAAILSALEELLGEARRELHRERSLKLAEVRKAIRDYGFTAAELRLKGASPR